MKFSQLLKELGWELRETIYTRYTEEERKQRINDAYEQVNIDALLNQVEAVVSVPSTAESYFTTTLPPDCISILSIASADKEGDSYIKKGRYEQRNMVSWRVVSSSPPVYYYDILFIDNQPTLFLQNPGTNYVIIRYLANVEPLENDEDEPFGGRFEEFHRLIVLLAAYLILRYDDPQQAAELRRQYENELWQLMCIKRKARRVEFHTQW